jgi:uncharacterized protein involved in oxidation of intracellular sulfur
MWGYGDGMMNREIPAKSEKILACGTCIKSRNQEGTEMCPINTMKDMYEIIKESDKVVTF